MTIQSINFIQEFNIRVREAVWEKYKDHIIKHFRFALKRLEDIDVYYEPKGLLPKNTLEQRVYRLELGYNGIGRPNGISSKIQSMATINLTSNDYTDDHLFGATGIGEHVHHEFKNNNYNIAFMIDDWLYKNLYLWGTVRVTKEEHKSYNIERNAGHKIDDKLKFRHYKNVSKLV